MVGSGLPKRIGGTKSESPRQRNLNPNGEGHIIRIWGSGVRIPPSAPIKSPPILGTSSVQTLAGGYLESAPRNSSNFSALRAGLIRVA